MRFLKNKIYLSQQLRAKQEQEACNKNASKLVVHVDESVKQPQQVQVTPKTNVSQQIKKPKNFDSSPKDISSNSPKTPEKIRCTKNIVKNYGRAIAKFACSEMALPYLIPIINERGIEYADALAFFTKAKTQIQGIDTFRALVLVYPHDDAKEEAFKITFQKIGEAFIKYFSVNWIFHSKIVHKSTYLKYRFKMLRRLNNPELFTYLKG